MKHLSILAVLLTAGMGSAQDMPLHEIIRPGETWQPTTNDAPLQPAGRYSVDVQNHAVQLDGKPLKLPLKEPTCRAVTLGDSTLLVADATDRYVWAFQIQKDGSIGPGDRYCRMRVRGDDRRKRFTPEEAYRGEPTAMTTDLANRTYVATNLGIQVFDPTGRLCGIFTPPPGKVTRLAFDGDRLYAHAGDMVYVRKMLAKGKSKPDEF